MSLDNERPDYHPGKIFPLVARFGDVAKGTLTYYQVHGVKQHNKGTMVLVTDDNSSGLYEMILKPDPGVENVFAVLMGDYQAGRVADLTDARLEQMAPLGTLKTEKPFKSGELVEGKGIYLDTWEPKNDRGQGVVFDIYAAPADIKGDDGQSSLMLSFNDAVKHVAGLKNFHGHDGSYFGNEKDIQDALLKSTDAPGKWFIPNEAQVDALYGHRDQGAFADTFTMTGGILSPSPLYHGICGRSNYARNFKSGRYGYHSDNKAFTRPVRAERRELLLAKGPV